MSSCKVQHTEGTKLSEAIRWWVSPAQIRVREIIHTLLIRYCDIVYVM